jgi:hypothetical protein
MLLNIPFEYESVSISWFGTPVEKALHSVVLQTFTEGAPGLPGLVEQALVYRGCHVPDPALLHRMASRYGRITFSTRQILA